MKLKLLIASFLFVLIANAQITDEHVLRNYIGANIFQNNVRNISATQLNNILNGTLNVVDLKSIDSFATSLHKDTFYVYQHDINNNIIRRGFQIAGVFDTTSLNNRINSLNTVKLNLGDSLSKYVTPAQLSAVSGGSVYHPGDNIVQISGTAISVDTLTKLPTKAFVQNNYTPNTRTVNNKPLTNNITLTKSDFSDLNNVDNTSDLNKPLSNADNSALSTKVDKTITVNTQPLSGNVVIDKTSVGLNNVDNTPDANKPVSAPQQIVFNTKESNFITVSYSNQLKFTTNKTFAPHQQTSTETFTVATDSMFVGKMYKFTVVYDTTGDSLVFPGNVIWNKDKRPQLKKTNIFTAQLLADSSILMDVSTVNANYANLIYYPANQVTFQTSNGYHWRAWWVQNNTSSDVNVFAGTQLGLSDIVPPRLIPPNAWVLIQPDIKFDASTAVFLTIPAGAGWQIDNPNLPQ